MAAVPSIGRAATVASATDATERLYDRHHRKIYAFCLYQLGNRDDAAEASQTTFMQALTALRRGVDPTFELPWLIAIARNVCRSRWDAGRRRRRIELARDPHDLASIAPAREVTELVGIEDALAALPEPQRRALVLREWQGLSYQEIADELGVTLSAAETLIFRGRRALARELGADEQGKRSFGIGSLLGGVKSAAGAGLTAKVAVGVVAAVGIGITAQHELARQAPTGKHAPAGAGRVQPATFAPFGTRAAPGATSPVPKSSAAPRPLAPERLNVTTGRGGSRQGTPAPGGPATSAPSAGGPAAAGTPAVTGAPTSSSPAPGAGADIAPARPAPGVTAPAPAAAPPSLGTAPPAPVTAAVQPVAGSSGDVGGAVAGAADTVVTKATDTVTKVATTATAATAPIVTTVTNTAAPVVTTVTNTAAPVVTTVTSALPKPPAPAPTPVPVPVQPPTITVPPVHLP